MSTLSYTNGGLTTITREFFLDLSDQSDRMGALSVAYARQGREASHHD